MYVVKHGELETNYRDVFKLLQTASFGVIGIQITFWLLFFVLLEIKRKSHMCEASGRICNFAIRISNYFVIKKNNFYYLLYS
jgi:hypothetical protein